MTRYIEYYEYTKNTYITSPIQYYYMPVNKECVDKINIDYGSDRIWRFDTKTDRRVCIKDRYKSGDVSNAEFLKIQLTSVPVPYNSIYHYKKYKAAKK